MRFALIVGGILALAPLAALAQANPPPKGIDPGALQSWLAAKNERLKAREAHVRDHGRAAAQKAISGKKLDTEKMLEH